MRGFVGDAGGGLYAVLPTARRTLKDPDPALAIPAQQLRIV